MIGGRGGLTESVHPDSSAAEAAPTPRRIRYSMTLLARRRRLGHRRSYRRGIRDGLRCERDDDELVHDVRREPTHAVAGRLCPWSGDLGPPVIGVAPVV